MAKKYVSYWSYLTTTSNVAKQLFKEEMGRNPKRKAKVRWCAEFDVSREIALSYPIVKEIVMREVSKNLLFLCPYYYLISYYAL